MARKKNITGTIYGDELLLAFRYIEWSYAKLVAGTIDNDAHARAWDPLAVDIAHHYGAAYWMATTALRAPTRLTLEITMDEAARKAAVFHIDVTAKNAINATSGNRTYHGLSKSDKSRLAAGLARFLGLVACGELTEIFLRNPNPPTSDPAPSSA